MNTSAPCAAVLYAGEDLSIVWYNDEYRLMVASVLSREVGVGMPLGEYSPSVAASRGPQYRQTLEDGVPRCGIDRFFSVEDGIRVVEWTTYRPLEGYLLVLLHPSGYMAESTASEPAAASSRFSV